MTGVRLVKVPLSSTSFTIGSLRYNFKLFGFPPPTTTSTSPQPAVIHHNTSTSSCKDTYLFAQVLRDPKQPNNPGINDCYDLTTKERKPYTNINCRIIAVPSLFFFSFLFFFHSAVYLSVGHVRNHNFLLFLHFLQSSTPCDTDQNNYSITNLPGIASQTPSSNFTHSAQSLLPSHLIPLDQKA